MKGTIWSCHFTLKIIIRIISISFERNSSQIGASCVVFFFHKRYEIKTHGVEKCVRDRNWNSMLCPGQRARGSMKPSSLKMRSRIREWNSQRKKRLRAVVATRNLTKFQKIENEAIPMK